MNQIELNVSEVAGKAWELTKKHGLILAVIILVFGLLTSSLSNIGFPWGSYFEAISENDTDAMLRVVESAGGFNALSILTSIISIIVYAGIMNIVIQITNGTMGKFDISGFKMPLMNYVYYTVGSIAVSIIIVAGSMLCIIPGIFLAVRLVFVPTHLLAHPEDGVMGAFSKSWEMTKGNFWNLFLLGLLACLICILGVICCCVGLYFAEAMILFMLAVAYYTLNTTPVAPVEEVE